MKAFDISFIKRAHPKSHRRSGRSHQDEYQSATVIAISAMEAGRMAENYMRKHLPKFEVDEIRLQNTIVIER